MTITKEQINVKLFGKVAPIYRLFRDGELIGVYSDKAERDAAYDTAVSLTFEGLC